MNAFTAADTYVAYAATFVTLTDLKSSPLDAGSRPHPQAGMASRDPAAVRSPPPDGGGPSVGRPIQPRLVEQAIAGRHGARVMGSVNRSVPFSVSTTSLASSPGS